MGLEAGLLKLAVSGLSGPVLSLQNAIQEALDRLVSVKLVIVADAASLPNAGQWQGRQIIMRDTNTVATAIDGAWYDPTGSAL